MRFQLALLANHWVPLRLKYILLSPINLNCNLSSSCSFPAHEAQSHWTKNWIYSSLHIEQIWSKFGPLNLNQICGVNMHLRKINYSFATPSKSRICSSLPCQANVKKMWNLPALLSLQIKCKHQALICCKYEQSCANVIFTTYLLLFCHPCKSIFSCSASNDMKPLIYTKVFLSLRSRRSW